MLKSLRKRSIRAGLIFFVSGGALAIALKKMFNDQFIEDAASAQQKQQRQQQQQQQSGPAVTAWQASAPVGRDAAEEEREYREFQEFKRFKEQKLLREQQQAAGAAATKTP